MATAGTVYINSVHVSNEAIFFTMKQQSILILCRHIIHNGRQFISLSSVQSLAHRDLCSGSPPHEEAVRRVAAVAGPGCDAAASMPQPETLLEKSYSLVLQ